MSKISTVLGQEYVRTHRANVKAARCKSVWQGMQGEVLRDGVEVPEARSEQNSGG